MLLAVLGFFALGPPDWLDTGDKLASIGALVFAAGAMILSTNPAQAAVVNGGLDDLMAADLAGLVERQWAQESAVRLLRRPRPLAVRWSATVEGSGAGPNSGQILCGDAWDVAAAFRGSPTKRLVVVGASGAGKTVLALLLTLDLLGSRQPDEPVPVLLSVSTWDPREPLDSWLARRLAEEYPMLTDRLRYGEDALLRLVRAGRVLPVLDGLDEMSPRWCSVAITALNTVAAGRPVVLTCRSDAFADAVAAVGTPLDGAAVIELEPITAAAAAAYLPAGQIDGERRWARVIAELRDQPDGPLTQALSTPLMVYLARTVYAQPTTDPAHLADLERFPSRAHIEAHLLDQYLPAVYAPSAAPRDPAQAGMSHHRYDADQARAWLAFLATCLPDSAPGDLAWWDLPQRVTRWRLIAGVTAGCVAGLAFGLMMAMPITLVLGPAWGVPSGVAVAVCLGVAYGCGYGGRAAAPTRRPHQIRLRLRTLLAPTRASLVRSAQCAVHCGLRPANGYPPWPRGRVPSGAGSRNQHRHHCGAAGRPVDRGHRVSVLEPVRSGARAGCGHSTLQPRADRTASLLHVSLGFLVFGLSAGLFVGLLTSARDGLAAGLTVGGGAVLLGFMFTGLPASRAPAAGLGWAPFTIARIWLAAHRQIPFRLLRFLEDAHARGVLRQAGAVYQFRHARIRHHLTVGPSPAPSQTGTTSSQ
ncbi:NACHT domain-containing protein [Streptomyces sp. NPDC001530]|uniref:NACHT domain-containing protein n=1 Tax=Streptomyces sp. NPDC001530 TaxID=3364582 RepID=UPI0036C04A91